MPTKQEDFTIAAAGTTSQGIGGKGHHLQGLLVPTLDSTTIAFEASLDGTTWFDVYDNAATPALVTCGGADTGGKAVMVPEAVRLLSAIAIIRLVVASQTGGARTIRSIWESQR